ncbi:hypothetical protein BKA65DRAFT_61505 [Rhexocercosporidium sp. MPI-PUGE-AT-0058]|nr:hypothetical protein BKA65DRAFT_61505 [Rhexocercosporidium sp. MPI-PUGE-AT-0058]
MNNVNCGYWPVNISNLQSISSDDVRRFITSQYAKFVASGTAATTGYVSDCYNAAQLSTCDLMVNRQIQWTGTDNTSCPFATGQCVGGDSSAYTMTMKNITAAYYGINVDSTLSVSRENTCAPIIMDPYHCDDGHGGHGYCHFTYNGMNHTTPVRMDTANAYQVHGWFPQANFTVHPNFQVDVGNVSLVYLSRRDLVHLYETHDPIFRATEKVPLLGFEEGGYVPAWKDRVTAIGCAEKLQLCASFKGVTECSPWVGVVRGDENSTGLETFLEKCSQVDRGLVSLLLPKTPVLQTLGDAARASGSELIASQKLLLVPHLQTEIQTASGSDQWKLEGQWFNIILAVSQLAVIHFPIGSPFINTTVTPDEMAPESRFVCENVLIKSFKHTTIRLPGLIMLVVGSALVVLICSLGKYASAFFKSNSYLREILQSWESLSWESQTAMAILGAAGRS